MKLFELNEGQKRRLLNDRESSPKSSIYEIISLWIRLISILELSYLHSRSPFWHRFLFKLAILVHDNDNMHQKIKLKAEI